MIEVKRTNYWPNCFPFSHKLRDKDQVQPKTVFVTCARCKSLIRAELARTPPPLEIGDFLRTLCLHCAHKHKRYSLTHQFVRRHHLNTREAINYPSGGWWLCTHLSNKKECLSFDSCLLLPLSISWLWELIYSSGVAYMTLLAWDTAERYNIYNVFFICLCDMSTKGAQLRQMRRLMSKSI